MESKITDMKRFFIAGAAASALMLAAGCGQNVTSGTPEQNGSRTGYSLAFFRNVSAHEGEDSNVLVSPYSAGVALSMLADGAEGQTRDEIVAALGGCTFAGDTLAADSLVDVRSANSAWLRSGFGLKKEYVQRLEKTYGAMIAEKDFSSLDAADAINAWCADNTEGRITEIVDRISPDMMMFLVNALYFKATWEKAFSPERTSDRTFYGSAGERKVPMMSIREDFRYAEWQGSQLIELPYAGGRYSMLIALPAEGLDMETAVSCLSEKAYEAALASMQKRKVALTLPKFRFDTDMTLNTVLYGMGIKKAFSSSARFGLMSETPVTVDQVRQKCFIEVNEEGSEAAAVTSIGLRLTSARPVEMAVDMTVDRPFLFALVDRDGGDILFLGRVMNIE